MSWGIRYSYKWRRETDRSTTDLVNSRSIIRPYSTQYELSPYFFYNYSYVLTTNYFQFTNVYTGDVRKDTYKSDSVTQDYSLMFVYHD